MPDRELEMEIYTNERGCRVLKFHGGPTGFEEYRVQDLLTLNVDNQSKWFCICAGTINSWPYCAVNRKEVFEFIRENIRPEDVQ